MKEIKNYTPEQIADAEKMCKLINKIPIENRTFVTTLMLAYMNGMEAGIAYAQDARVAT